MGERVALWPDGFWCREGMIEEYYWKSDDYRLVGVPDDADDEQVERLLAQLEE